MDKTLSISVAAYNVEKTLDRTLSSLINQNIIDDIEVLIINDGSKDNTEVIAEKYCRQYPNSFFYIKKENGGWGTTVNKSIELAKGKYFKLLDGDDWFDTEKLEEVVNKLKTTSSDLVLTDYTLVEKDGNIVKSFNYKTGEELPINSLVQFSMHALTVKTSLLKENHISLLQNCFYTDAEFNIKVINVCKNYIYWPINLYMYSFGIDGNQSVSINNFIKRMDEHEKVLRTIIPIAKKNTKFEQIVEPYIFPLINHQIRLYLLSEINKNKYNSFKDFKQFVYDYYPLSLKKADKSVKIACKSPYLVFKFLHFLMKK